MAKQIPLIDCDPNFIHIFRYMFRNSEARKMGPYAFMVYACIKTYSNIKTGSAWPGIEKIVEETGISRAKVITSVKQLCDMGYVKKEEKAGKVNKYTIVEKIPYTSSDGSDTGNVTFDYTPTLLQTAMSEVRNFAMTGDAKDAKIIHIEQLTINIVNQGQDCQFIQNFAHDALTEKMQSLPEDNPVRKAWEASKRTDSGVGT